MSDFCDFVPDDPSCAPKVDPQPKPDDNGGAGPPAGGEGGPGPDGPEDNGSDPSGGDGKMDGGDHDWSSMDDKKGMTWEEFDEKAGEYFHPMEANIAYFTVAAGFVADAALKMFVWHETNADTLSQAASGSGNTDYFKLLHQVEGYGVMGVWGLAALTQLLATFGVMVGINMMVWGTVVPMVGGLVELASMAIAFMAYDQFFKQSELATPNATAGAYMARMERDMANHAASHIAGHFEMYLEMSSWIWAAYMNSSDEDKEMWREDKDFLMMLDLTPEKVEKWGMNDDKKEMKEMDGMDEKKEGGPPKLLMRLANF